MKLIVILFFIFGVSCAIYLFITYFVFNFNKLRKINWIAFWISAFVGASLMTITGIAIYRGSKAPDTWCTTKHVSNSYPPANLVTAMDYFEKGNYEYDLGDCKKAIADYEKSIELDDTYPQSYNNLAYTHMRMGNYSVALANLDIALNLNPNYTNALMNRGDIYNYQLNEKDKAIADYEKIISVGGLNGNVCGHLAMAKRFDSKNWFTYLKVPFEVIKCQKR